MLYSKADFPVLLKRLFRSHTAGRWQADRTAAAQPRAPFLHQEGNQALAEITGEAYRLSCRADTQSDCPLVEAVICYGDGTPLFCLASSLGERVQALCKPIAEASVG